MSILSPEYQAERAALGRCLAEGAPVVAELRNNPPISTDERHALVFAAMDALAQAGKPIDHLTVSVELKERDQLRAVGGPAYLMELDVV